MKSRKSRKSRVVIPLASGDYLGEVGYHVSGNITERRKKLIKAVNKHGYKAIVLRLNATAIRLKRYQDTHDKLRSDMLYLKKYFKSKTH